ncbi:MAG TPA: sulfatase-like hydrolase/transferase [Planctomycetes bacterium]|nr:sulfatase-like hydrolase/transferase [Planctomycetota bacterium]
METVGYTRRDFLKKVGLGAASLAVPGCAGGAQRVSPKASTDKPNFIIIFTDDQGYQDVGCFGSPNINTPNLDRMAAEGMKFTDFYVAASICSPSRAALLTGCYPPRVSITKVLFPRDSIGLNPKEVTIADILKAQGYATACVGKWHLGHLPQFLPMQQGFDSYYGIPYSNDMRIKRGDKSGPPLMRNEDIIEHPAEQATLTQRYTEESIKFITENKNRPFFLYLPHTMPHVPLFVSEKFKGKSKRGLYGDVIEEIDWSVGRILKTLKELGIDEKTLVLFTSDNGPWLGKKHHGGSALPLRDGKFTTYEGGMREPTIMRWPGEIPEGKVCGEVCGTIDLLPTFARLAGAEPPADRVIDGKDIWPLISGRPRAKSPHKAFFYYRGNKLEAVRSGRWKLHRKKKTALYDLEIDISEKNNLAAGHPKIVKRLTGVMEKFDRELKANARPPGRAAEKNQS